MTAITLPLNDWTQWPLRMTKREVAHVLRRSLRTFDRLAKQGLVPAPDGDGFFIRAEIERFVNGNVRVFDKQRKKVA